MLVPIQILCHTNQRDSLNNNMKFFFCSIKTRCRNRFLIDPLISMGSSKVFSMEGNGPENKSKKLFSDSLAARIQDVSIIDLL